MFWGSGQAVVAEMSAAGLVPSMESYTTLLLLSSSGKGKSTERLAEIQRIEAEIRQKHPVLNLRLYNTLLEYVQTSWPALACMCVHSTVIM